jgi:hypothetical protein
MRNKYGIEAAFIIFTYNGSLRGRHVMCREHLTFGGVAHFMAYQDIYLERLRKSMKNPGTVVAPSGVLNRYP